MHADAVALEKFSTGLTSFGFGMSPKVAPKYAQVIYKSYLSQNFIYFACVTMIKVSYVTPNSDVAQNILHVWSHEVVIRYDLCDEDAG